MTVPTSNFTITYARENGVLTATVTGDSNGLLKVNGNIVTSPYVMTIDANTTINAQSVDKANPAITGRTASEYVPASYLKNVDGKILIDDFSGVDSTSRLGQLKAKPFDGSAYISGYDTFKDSTFVHTSTDSTDTFGSDDSVKVNTNATAWSS